MGVTSKEFTVIRDTREQTGWFFPKNEKCLGTITQGLKTGDYSIIGRENEFVIERKASTSEFATNVVEPRFVRELERLEQFKQAFIICEFTYSDILCFPIGSGIPKSKWDQLRITPKFMEAMLHDWELKYKMKFILAGPLAQTYALQLFKRMAS